MDTLSPRLAALASPLLSLFTPESRLFFPFMLVATAIALVVTWREQRDRSWRSLFDRRVLTHPSALADYRFVALKAIVRATLFPGYVLSTLVVAALVAGALRRWLGVEARPDLPRFVVGAVFTITAFVADDLTRFLVHRSMHRVPWLWEVHKVHHSAEVMTPLTLYRTHPIESLLNQLRGVVTIGAVTGVAVAYCGPSLAAWQILGVDALGFLWSLLGANLRHSHVWISYGRRWGKLLLSPAQHQVHHSADPKHADRNYGEVLAIWDWLGGSLYVTEKPEALRFGLTDGSTVPQRATTLLWLPLLAWSRPLVHLWRERRRRRSLSRTASALALLALVAGCQTRRFDRGALAASLGQCSLDVYKQGEARHVTLAAAVDAYAADRSAEKRAAAQTAWHELMQSWQTIELLQFGPLAGADSPGGQNLRDAIYAWPNVNRCLIEQQLVGNLYEGATFAFLPAATRGLGALEYLLFYEGSANGCDPSAAINTDGSWAALTLEELDRRKAAYAKAIAQDVRARFEALRTAWEPTYLAELHTAGRGSKLFVSHQVAINTVAAALLHLDTGTKDLRLGKPLGLRDCATATCPEAVESPWAKRGKQAIANNLAGFELLFHGCQPAASPSGFDDWLVSLGARSIAEAMTADLAAAKSAVAAVPEDDLALAIAQHPAEVMALYEAVKTVTDALKQEVTMTLQIQPPNRVEGDND